MARAESPAAAFTFDTEVISWRGPSPFFFAPIPQDQAEALRAAARRVSYGWGVVPVEAEVGGVVFQTSLFPKGGTYLLPLKMAVRRKADITAGDAISVRMTLRPGR